MPCTKIDGWIVCVTTVYNYGGFYFEDSIKGPWPLRKRDLMPYRFFPGEKHRFWHVYYEFSKLSDEEKERHILR